MNNLCIVEGVMIWENPIWEKPNQDAEANYENKPSNHPGDKLDIFFNHWRLRNRFYNLRFLVSTTMSFKKKQLQDKMYKNGME